MENFEDTSRTSLVNFSTEITRTRYNKFHGGYAKIQLHTFIYLSIDLLRIYIYVDNFMSRLREREELQILWIIKRDSSQCSFHYRHG